MPKGGGGPSASAMGQAQSQANQAAMLQSILGSQFNQETPFGNLTWSGDVPIVDQATGRLISQGQGGEAGQPSPAGPSPGMLQPSYGPGGEYFPPEPLPPSAGGTAPMPGQGQQSNPRTMKVTLSPHGQYMQGGQENIAKALLDRASRTTTQVQEQPAFRIADLGLPSQVSGIGNRELLSGIMPPSGRGLPPQQQQPTSAGLAQIVQSLMGRGR